MDKWVVNKIADADKLKSVTIYEDTHDLLKELKEETGVSMSELIRSALLFANNHKKIEE